MFIVKISSIAWCISFFVVIVHPITSARRLDVEENYRNLNSLGYDGFDDPIKDEDELLSVETTVSSKGTASETDSSEESNEEGIELDDEVQENNADRDNDEQDTENKKEKLGPDETDDGDLEIFEDEDLEFLEESLKEEKKDEKSVVNDVNNKETKSDDDKSEQHIVSKEKDDDIDIEQDEENHDDVISTPIKPSLSWYEKVKRYFASLG